jgi:hypothetical protein
MNILFYVFLIIHIFFGVEELDLNKLKWENRIICIESSDLSLLSQQLNEFEHKAAELKDRKLLIFVKNKGRFYEWPKKKYLDVIHNFPKTKNRDFQITLIGLDGGQKLQAFLPVKSIDIFNLIDSMPMRISEKN